MAKINSTLVKTQKGDNVYIFKRVILSPFSALFNKSAYKDNTPKYMVNFQFEKDSELGASIFKLLEFMAMQEFDGKSYKHFVNDGDNQEGFDTVREYFQGHYFMRIKSDSRPAIYNIDRSRIEEDTQLLYPGCIVNVTVQPYVATKYGRQINFNLIAVQRVSNPPDSLALDFNSGRQVSSDMYMDDLDMGEDEENFNVEGSHQSSRPF